MESDRRREPGELVELTATAPSVTYRVTRSGYEIDGRLYRRVTGLLGGIPAPWLEAWAVKQTAEYAVKETAWRELPNDDAVKLLKGARYKKLDRAGNRGSRIHEAIEEYVKTGDVADNLAPDETACLTNVITFLERRGSRLLGSEITVFSNTHEYAGTFDLWE